MSTSDKEHILGIIDAFQSVDGHKGISSQYSQFKVDLDDDGRKRIRNKLLRGELIHLQDEHPERIRLTAKGYCAEDKDFDKDGNYIEKGERYLKVIKNLAIIPIVYALFKCIEQGYVFFMWLFCGC